MLAATTVADTRAVYGGIRQARPGGLGQVDAEDVRAEPTATLLDVMTLAAERDAIAREYATGFATTFDIGVPALVRARRSELSWDDAIVETYLTLLAHQPDTLIARKRGGEAAADVSRRATAVLAIGGVRTGAGRADLAAFDLALRDPSNALNPGTTADLTAAAAFVALLGVEPAVTTDLPNGTPPFSFPGSSLAAG